MQSAVTYEGCGRKRKNRARNMMFLQSSCLTWKLRLTVNRYSWSLKLNRLDIRDRDVKPFCPSLGKKLAYCTHDWPLQQNVFDDKKSGWERQRKAKKISFIVMFPWLIGRHWGNTAMFYQQKHGTPRNTLARILTEILAETGWEMTGESFVTDISI